MLKLITWNQYFLFVVAASSAWYAFVFLRTFLSRPKSNENLFSPVDRTGLFSQEGNEPFQKQPNTLNAGVNQFSTSNDSNELYLITQTVSQEIITEIAEAANDGISEPELCAHLQVILSNYPILKNTAQGIALNNMIIQKGKAVGFSLSKEDVGKFWD